jgi:prepilin-type N-terminal cleavage/methylation domain-containing protein
MQQTNHNIKGFTLIEILIVIALVATIAGLFLDPISRIYEFRGRIKEHTDYSHQNMFFDQWFRQTVMGVYMTNSVFKGSKNSFSGVTFYPMDDEIGLPTPFEWRISYEKAEDRTYFEYIGFNEDPIVLHSWDGDYGYFEYFDDSEGDWQKQWQEFEVAGEAKDKVLPSMIRFVGRKRGKEWTIVAPLEPSRGYVKNAKQEVDEILARMKKKIQLEKAKEIEEGAGESKGDASDFKSKFKELLEGFK